MATHHIDIVKQYMKVHFAKYGLDLNQLANYFTPESKVKIRQATVDFLSKHQSVTAHYLADNKLVPASEKTIQKWYSETLKTEL